MKKNKFVLTLSLLLALGITVGCSSNPTTTEKPVGNEANAIAKKSTATNVAPSASSYKDGTYEGSSDAGIHPGLKVTVVVKDGKISEIKVTEHHETDGIGSVAIEKLPSLIVTSQSTQVDSVTGASKSSGAIKEAVEKALTQAK